MDTNRRLRFVILLLAASLLLNWLPLPMLAGNPIMPVWSTASPAGGAAETKPASPATAASPALSPAEWQSIDAQIAQAEYHFALHQPADRSAPPYYWAPNRQHGYRLQFDPSGLRVQPDQVRPAWSLKMGLKAYTIDGKALTLATEPRLAASAERLEYAWGAGLTEWYVNTPAGLEHGFTVLAPPISEGGSENTDQISLRIVTSGSLTPGLSAPDQAVRFTDSTGAEVLRYASLKAWDARGRSLPASLSVEGATILLNLDARQAQYPLTIDPLLTGQTNLLTAFDAANGDSFGAALALDGDLLAVGKPDQPQDSVDSNGAGAVYLFRRNQSGSDSWTLLKKLTASDGAESDRFGGAIDIEGDLMIVGARGVFAAQGNKAYLYARNQGGVNNWGEVRKLHSLATLEVGSRFGSAVALSGDLAFVGAPDRDSGRGAVHRFQRNQGGANNWGQVAMMEAADANTGRAFGSSLAAYGDALVVGDPGFDNDPVTMPDSGSAYAFHRNKNGADQWGQADQFFSQSGQSNDRFGASVAIHGNWLAIGEPGEDVSANASQGMVYVFERHGGGIDDWGLRATLTASDGAASDSLGSSVAIHGDSLVAGASRKTEGANFEQGAAYLFTRNRGGTDQWKQTARLRDPDGAASDVFGGAVAISGDWLVAGAPGDNASRGSVHIFRREQGQLYQGVTLLDPTGTINNFFGRQVALRGDLALVGASNASATGAAFLFERNSFNTAGGAEQWDLVKKLTPSNGVSGDNFGVAVALLEDMAFVGAHFRNSANGAVYLYGRNQGSLDNWGELPFQLSGSALTPEEEFGRALAVDGDTLVIGAPNEQANAQTTEGAVYIHRRNQGGAEQWGFVKKLTIPDGDLSDFFGTAVAISGDWIAAGAPGEDISGQQARGAVYLFNRNLGGSEAWSQARKLTLANGAAQDRFGAALALTTPDTFSGVLAAGAPGRTVNSLGGAGQVSIYYQNQDGADQWGLVRQVNASDPQANAAFGSAVDISGDRLLAGAPDASTSGAAYLFERNRNGADLWGQSERLAPGLAAALDFGSSVAIEHDHLLAGAPASTVNSTANRGAAFIFHLSRGAWFPTSRTAHQTPTADDKFGNAVAVDGEWLAIGAPFDDFNSLNNAGSVFLFRRSGVRNWQFFKQITAPTPATEDQFGAALALQGDVLAVGAPLDNDTLTDQGAVHVFHRSQGGADNWGFVKLLAAQTPAADDRFGAALALDGDTLAVGAYLDNATATDQGSVTIFSRHLGGTDNWGLRVTRLASDGATSDQFGFSVALDGDILVVGAPLDNGSATDQGSIYILKRSQGGSENWGQVGSALTANDAAASDQFGYAVALVGDTLAVGAPFDNHASGSDQGSVYLFGRIQSGVDVFSQGSRLTSPNPVAGDSFGFSVATNELVIVAGAPVDSLGFASSQGSAFVFERDQGGAFKWGAVQELNDGDGAANDRFGAAVAISGDVIAIGAPDANPNGQNNAGQALVFIAQPFQIFLPVITR